ncbi:MAG TPA: ATP-binding protein [Gaiellaceae bacterium]|nr:ATP-binding protein [Gaiellaceae bacterium]
MTGRFIGVRWWLGAAFAVVAAVSTAIVVAQFSSRSENEFRGHAETLAAGSAYLAAARIPGKRLAQRLPAIAQRFDLDLHVYDATGRLVGQAPARTSFVHAPKEEAEVLRAAKARERRVVSTENGGVVVIGVPLGDRVVVALSRRPDIAAAVGILNDQALRAGVIAGVIGVLVGLLLAQLIALRLRRLSAAAEAIAHGDFESPLHYRFRDEFGALAQSFDRMRRQLRRSFRHIEGERDRLRLLLERLHEGVVTVDESLVVRFANAEARRVLGAPLAEGDALPEPWDSFSLREFAAGLFTSGGQGPAQAHVRPDEEHALELVGIPAQPEGDTVLIVLDDLTEQERRELAEREFVSNAAHELRTPLTTIIGAVEVLQGGAKDDAVQRDRFLAHIEREAERLARLARALLTLARAHAGQERPRVETVALAPVLSEVAEQVRPLDGVVVEVECPVDLAAVLNRDLLEQALRNLAENAAKHTRAGRIVLRGAGAGTAVVVEVEDTGVGMSTETQQHVFDRFYRGRDRDAEGFGLGLAIVRQAVVGLSGEIALDSVPGEGTRVRMTFPAARVVEEVPAA